MGNLVSWRCDFINITRAVRLGARSLSLHYWVAAIALQPHLATAEPSTPPTLLATSDIVVVGQHFTATHPRGVIVELLNAELRQPRILHFHGVDLLLGSRSGAIYRLRPPYTEATVIAKLRGYPHSVVVRAGYLYVAREDGLWRARYEPQTEWLAPAQFTRYVALPSGGGHRSRTVKLGPQQQLFVSIGNSGNCRDEYLSALGADYPFAQQRGGIFVIAEPGGTPVLQPYGTGLRNPVGFDWQPGSGQLYATNNGPDHLGFKAPPEYFSRITAGSFHGMPWYQYDGERLVRDRCITTPAPQPATAVVVPSATFPARNAPMDVAFVPPHARYGGDAIVALHGSWATAGASGDPATRRPPKLVRVRFAAGEAVAVTDLVSGFQAADGHRWARPVGVAVGPDGAIYFTSDSGIEGLFRLRPQ